MDKYYTLLSIILVLTVGSDKLTWALSHDNHAGSQFNLVSNLSSKTVTSFQKN